MSDVIDPAPFDPLKQARMEIAALKIVARTVIAYLATDGSKENKETIRKRVNLIQNLVNSSIDKLEFTDMTVSDEWRVGIKESVKSVFEFHYLD